MNDWKNSLPKTDITMTLNDEPPEAWDRAYNSGIPKKWKEETVKNIGEEQFQTEFDCSFLGSSNTLIHAKKLSTLYFSFALSAGLVNVFI